MLCFRFLPLTIAGERGQRCGTLFWAFSAGGCASDEVRSLLTAAKVVFYFEIAHFSITRNAKKAFGFSLPHATMWQE
ncbi:MAG: hypothetical protein HXK16_03975 [Alloprevotella sp.]|nr:hypothetical protein [Alloprevotella sp.]